MPIPLGKIGKFLAIFSAAALLCAAAVVSAAPGDSGKELTPEEASLVREAVPKWVTDLKEGRPVERRRSAAASLAKAGPLAAAALPALARSLADPDREVRHSAVWALGRMGPIVCSDPSAVQGLNRLVKSSRESEEVREAAVSAVAEIGPCAEVMPALLQASTDPNVRVRVAAARGMARNPDSPEVPAALAVLLTDSNEEVIEAAAMALTQIGSAGAPPLVAGLGSPLEQTRRWTRRAVEKLGVSAAKSLAQLLVDSSAEEDLRETAADLLVKIGPAAAPIFAEALADPQWQIRRISCRALGAIGPSVADNPKVLAKLLKALKDPQWQIRQEAAVTLGKIKARSAKKALLKLLNDNELGVQNAAESALENLEE